MAELALKSVCKSFGEVEVIKSVDLDVSDGEFVVFVGPSGCGKSTLLRMLAGLEDVTKGNLLIGGEDVTSMAPIDRGVAMVFQSYALYPHMTVAENIGFGLKIAGLPKSEISQKVAGAAEILKLEELLERKPKALSGGQRQRVAIGRAIVKQPKIFLFDEPLSNLDAELRVQMRLEIAKLHEELGATMIYVTHDQVEAMTLADKIVVLRGGIIEQYGRPVDLYLDPDNVFVAGFIGSPAMNILPCSIANVGEENTEVRVDSLSEQPISVSIRNVRDNTDYGKPGFQFGFRPEHANIEPGGAMKGKVQTVEKLGSVSYLYMETEDGTRLTIEDKGLTSIVAGDIVEFNLHTEYVYVFDSAGLRV